MRCTRLAMKAPFLSLRTADLRAGAHALAPILGKPAQLSPFPEQVAANFNHVFVPPWAVPKAPEQQTVAMFREAAVQTSTGACEQDAPVPLRSTHTADDAADHFQVGAAPPRCYFTDADK